MPLPRPIGFKKVKQDNVSYLFRKYLSSIKKKGSEPNQARWVGIRPISPAETIPVEEQSPLTELAQNLIPGTNNNPSFDIDYDASDRIDQIDMTIGGTTYRRTIAYTAGGMIDTISAWVEV